MICYNKDKKRHKNLKNDRMIQNNCWLILYHYNTIKQKLKIAKIQSKHKKEVVVMLTMKMVRAMLDNQKGQGMVEYGLILALIAVVAIGTMTTIGTDLATKLGTVAAAL